MRGSVALTGADAPTDVVDRDSNIEQLVDELDLARNLGLTQEAMAASDHTHDFKSLENDSMGTIDIADTTGLTSDEETDHEEIGYATDERQD